MNLVFVQALELHHKLILLALVESRLGKGATGKKALTLEQVRCCYDNKYTRHIAWATGLYPYFSNKRTCMLGSLSVI